MSVLLTNNQSKKIIVKGKGKGYYKWQKRKKSMDRKVQSVKWKLLKQNLRFNSKFEEIGTFKTIL